MMTETIESENEENVQKTNCVNLMSINDEHQQINISKYACKQNNTEGLCFCRHHIKNSDCCVNGQNNKIHNSCVRLKKANFYQIVDIFCKNSSLRGVSKISRASSLFLRCLWFLFVLFMFILLIYASAKLVSNYRDYNVAIQTSLTLNNDSYFPTVTICNHYPFSDRAMQLWKDGKTLSPKEFNTMLRNLTFDLLNNKLISYAKKIPLYDQSRVYYQNLPKSTAVNISHSVNELVRHCMINFDGVSLVGNHQDCGLKFELLSIPRYFNCYSITPQNDYYSRKVSSIYLILDLGKEADFGKWEQAFITDIFDQAYGLRLSIHENNLIPNIERDGIHIEPEKMVEITVDSVHWKVITDSPKDQCHTGMEPYVYDLGKNYSYSYEGCMDQHLNKVIINSCNCMLSRLPRPVVKATKTLPYCGYLNPDELINFFKRLTCLETMDEKKIRASVDGKICKKRCTSFTYDKHFSTTKWRPTNFQLHWMIDQSQSWRDLLEAYSDRNKEKVTNITHHINKYLTSIDLIKDVPPTTTFSLPSSNKYAYVIIKRNSFDTIVKEEKLTVTFEALMSRIGGLCSLCLGLTMAFFCGNSRVLLSNGRFYQTKI